MAARVTKDRSKTEQVVGTPPAFLRSVERLLGQSFTYDLACTRRNKVAPMGYTVEDCDSLAPDVAWPEAHHLAWLNPPFKHVAPWAKKCSEAQCTIALLVPASVGSNWFWKHVYGKASVLPVYPRITFVGHTDRFPKDLMLCVYRPRVTLPPFGRFISSERGAT